MKKAIKMLIEVQKEKHYSDTMMAAMLNVSHATYVRWKKGKTVPKNISCIANIVKFLEDHTL